MTVPVDETGQSTHVGNGTTDTYDYEYKITSAEDLTVSLIDASGNVTVLSYASGDYTVAGVGDDDGGSITLTAGNLATGITLLIEDEPDIAQTRPFGRQGAFFGSLHENAFDLLTRLIRKVDRADDRTLVYPATGGNFDAQNKQIDNLAAGTASGDATNLAQVIQLIGTLAMGLTGGNWDAENLRIENMAAPADDSHAVNRGSLASLVADIITNLSGLSIEPPVEIPLLDSSGNFNYPYQLSSNNTYILPHNWSATSQFVLPANPSHGDQIILKGIPAVFSSLTLWVDPSGNSGLSNHLITLNGVRGLLSASGADTSGNFTYAGDQLSEGSLHGAYNDQALVNWSSVDSSGNKDYPWALVSDQSGNFITVTGQTAGWGTASGDVIYRGWKTLQLGGIRQLNDVRMVFLSNDSSGNFGYWSVDLGGGDWSTISVNLTGLKSYNVDEGGADGTTAAFFSPALLDGWNAQPAQTLENFFYFHNYILRNMWAGSMRTASSISANIRMGFNFYRGRWFGGNTAQNPDVRVQSYGGTEHLFNAGSADIRISYNDVADANTYGTKAGMIFIQGRSFTPMIDSSGNIDTQPVGTLDNIVIPPGEHVIIKRENDAVFDSPSQAVPNTKICFLFGSPGCYVADSSGNPVTLQLDSSGNPGIDDVVQLDSSGNLDLPTGNGIYFVQAATGTTDTVAAINGGGPGSEVTLLGYPGHTITVADNPGTIEAAGSPTLTGSNWDVLKLLNVAGRWIKSGYETN